MSRLFVLVQYLLPQHGLSRLTGWLASSSLLNNLLIRLFILCYRVDLEEAEIPEPDGFKNFNAFFTRSLKPGARPLANGSRVVLCPVDGAVSEIGRIDGDRILQAKGHSYTTARLLADAKMARVFDGGVFATLYLAPRDYHRIHMPLAGTLQKTLYVPGRLFSVNRTTASLVPGLFACNERLVCLFSTPAGAMALVLVGAMIVAGIETVWAGQACPNQEQRVKIIDYSGQTPPIQLIAGAELGHFKLGSTAIVLFEPGAVTLSSLLTANCKVRMGQRLGECLRTAEAAETSTA
ncbi:MAG: archaetidylserine decarboxylase [Gammaproteobacteria bacterium]|nr:archaetidylserine decarboxylase [Gammaproteobacteria bacterium]MCY4355949.1 archaetidylserine decarboxylase [Gammaproteobacteria bacterium]